MYTILDLETTRKYSFIGLYSNKSYKNITQLCVSNSYEYFPINTVGEFRQFTRRLNGCIHNKDTIFNHNLLKFDYAIIYLLNKITICLPKETIITKTVYDIVQLIIKNPFSAKPWVIIPDNKYVFVDNKKYPATISTNDIEYEFSRLCNKHGVTFIDTLIFYTKSLKTFAKLNYKDFDYGMNLNFPLEECIEYNKKDLFYTFELFNSEDVQEGLVARRIVRDRFVGKQFSKCKYSFIPNHKLGDWILRSNHTDPNKKYKCSLSNNEPCKPPSYYFIKDINNLKTITTDDLKSIIRSIDSNKKININTNFDTTSDEEIGSITIGDIYLPIKLGGLHAVKPKYIDTLLESSATVTYVNIDVASYYPSLIIQSSRELHADLDIVDVITRYKNLLKVRLKAKADKGDKSLDDKVRKRQSMVSNELKLALNSVFGKSPIPLKYNTTIRGQLYFVDLISYICKTLRHEVLMVNTDGIILRIANGIKEALVDVNKIIDYVRNLCDHQSYELEYSVIEKAYIKGVNSYSFIAENETKRAGIFKADLLDVGKDEPPLLKEIIFNNVFHPELTVEGVIRKSIESESFIQFIRKISCNKLTKSPKSGSKDAEIRVSYDGKVWESCQNSTFIPINEHGNSITLRKQIIGETYSANIAGYFLEVTNKIISKEFFYNILELLVEYYTEKSEEKLSKSRKNTSDVRVFLFKKLTMKLDERKKNIVNLTIIDIYKLIVNNVELKETTISYRNIKDASAKRLFKISRFPTVYENKPSTPSKTRKDYLSQKSVIILDIDNMGDFDALKAKILKYLPNVILLYRSSSKKGLHFWVPVNIKIQDSTIYHIAITKMIEYFEQLLGVSIDRAGSVFKKTISICHDESAYFNQDALLYNIEKFVEPAAHIDKKTKTALGNRHDFSELGIVNEESIHDKIKQFKEIVIALFPEEKLLIRLQCINFMVVLREATSQSNVRKKLKLLQFIHDELFNFALTRGRQTKEHLMESRAHLQDYLGKAETVFINSYNYLRTCFKKLLLPPKELEIYMEDAIASKEDSIILAPTGSGKTYSSIRASLGSHSEKVIFFIYTQTKISADQSLFTAKKLIKEYNTDIIIIKISRRDAVILKHPYLKHTIATEKILKIAEIESRHIVVILHSPLLEEPEDSISRQKFYYRVSPFIQSRKKKIIIIDEVDQYFTKQLEDLVLTVPHIKNPTIDNVLSGTTVSFGEKRETVIVSSVFKKVLKDKSMRLREDRKKSYSTEIDGESIWREIFGEMMVNVMETAVKKGLAFNLKSFGVICYKINCIKLFEKILNEEITKMGTTGNVIISITDILDMVYQRIESSINPLLIYVYDESCNKSHPKGTIILRGINCNYFNRLKSFNAQIIGLTATWEDSQTNLMIEKEFKLNIRESLISDPCNKERPRIEKVNLLKLKESEDEYECHVFDLIESLDTAQDDKKYLVVIETSAISNKIIPKLRNYGIRTSYIYKDGILDLNVESALGGHINKLYIMDHHSAVSRGINLHGIDHIYLTFSNIPRLSFQCLEEAIDAFEKKLSEGFKKKVILNSCLQLIGRLTRAVYEKGHSPTKGVTIYYTNKDAISDVINLYQFLNKILSPIRKE